MQDELQISSAAISDRGLSEKRPQNEDSYLELRESGLFAVADGVGGAQAGDVASQMAMEILAEAFINMQEDGDAESRMKQAIERANSAIFQMSHDLPQLSSMATTVVALHINGNVATICHVGDSRLYRLHPNGELVQETLDHSVVEEEVRAGRMTPEQAAVHPSRNVISRALGAEPLVEIDLKTVIVEPNTTFLACSDGVTRHIPDHELRDLLQNAPDSMELCQTIKEICYDRGAEDNLTAVIVKAESTFEDMEADFGEGSDIEEEAAAAARAGESSEVFGLTADTASEAETLADDEVGSNEDFSDDILVQEGAAAGGGDANSISMSGSNQSFLSILSDGNTEESESSVTVEEERKGSRIGKAIKMFFFAVVFLVLGGAAGGAAMWFYGPMLQPPPPAPEPQPQKIEVSSFEATKAKVFEDPVAAIATLSANPQNAEDFYFLGLAYLLNARYTEAGVALASATEKLPEYDEGQRSNLAKEIALANAVVGNPIARESFANEVENAAAKEAETSAKPGLPAGEAP